MDDSPQSRHDRWARLRFSIIGPLLASPPERGDLGGEIRKLAQKTWRHPISGEAARFGPSTIERWYYTARNERQDPVGALRRRVRKDAGHAARVSAALGQTLRAQHRAHPSWSAQLHADNLAVLVKGHPELGPMPSYSTIRRWMKSQGLFRRRRFPQTPGGMRAEHRLGALEVRSFEAASPGRLGRPLPSGLSRPVVPRRNRRDPDPRIIAGLAEARTLPGLDDRQRQRHAGWRDRPGARSAGHPP